MKKTFLLSFILSISMGLLARGKDSTIYYNLPDSVKAVQLLTEITVNSYGPKGGFSFQLRAGGPSIVMSRGRFVFCVTELEGLRPGINTSFNLKDYGFVYKYEWQLNETYKLLIAQATDSAAAVTIYSGYVFLPREGKWKFMGSYPVKTWNASLYNPSLNYRYSKKQEVNFTNGQTWVQRSNGSWKNLKGETLPNPVINLFGHMDSAKQRSIDMEKMTASLKGYQYKDGVAYEILKEGNGRQVEVTDTVSVYYHVNILNDTATIDEAKNTPARFPLNRLIRGWSIGVPLIKVGGKIRLVIPSDLAYSIRTRSAKIPPNSILEFIIEVVDANSPN